MANRETDLRSKIQAELKTQPKTLSELARSIGASQSGVHYQLGKMLKEGVLIKSVENKFHLADIKQIEKDTLKAIIGLEIEDSKIHDFELAKIHGEEKIRKAIENLKDRGLVEFRDGDKYRIAPEGAKELGICYFCNGKIRNGQAVLANIYGWGDYNFGVLCHPSCISNWFRNMLGDEAGWGIDDSIICDFCGLPLSLDILKRFTRAERHYVNYNELEKHLSTNEKKALKELKKDQVNFRRYEDIGQLVDKIVDESKKQKISLENYDPHQRKKELWNITQELLKTEDGWVYGRLWHSSERHFYSRLVKNALKKLVDPISIIYSVITEPSYAANSVKMYVGGDHSLAIVKDSMKYHPYCYKMMNELEIVSQRIENNESKRIRNI